MSSIDEGHHSADVTLHRIGEVAERTGLSLRTIRWYDEVGVVVPSGRSSGGFRLYTEDDVQRLEDVKAFKPLDFSLDETREVMLLRDRVGRGDELDADETARLALYAEFARTRCAILRDQLQRGETLAELLQECADAAAPPGRDPDAAR